MVDIAIITAPRRIPTLDASLESLRRAGVKGHIWIFAEPGPLALDDANVTIIIHPRPLGAFANYNYALDYLMEHGQGHRLAVLEDDYIYSPRLGEALEAIDRTTERFGYFNLFTNGQHPKMRELCPREGWNRLELGFNGAWGVAYVFDRGWVRAIQGTEIYRTTLREKNRVIDGAVSEACLRLKLAMWYHNPSLAYTLNVGSTLGNEFNTDGLNFKGK